MESKEKTTEVTMDKIISLAKRRGFIYPGSEIYGGLSGTWDWGPLGVALKRNIQNLWWRKFVSDREDVHGVDTAILMNAEVWRSAGHAEGFTDPLVECQSCKHRFRADHIEGKVCPDCGGVLGAERKFNMMFETRAGALEDSSSLVYLRPETAQGMFVNFKNVLDSLHPKLPFGLAQIGKAFRNEITPRDFVFRVREFEQMEIEYFVRPAEWEKYFELWREEMKGWMTMLGIRADTVHELLVPDGERAHYSSKTIDFEFDFPFGRKELYGLAYRGDFDLSVHAKGSGKDLTYFDEATGERFLPHVIEPTFGVERTVLAVLLSAYAEDALGEGVRTYLKLPPAIAPVTVAVFPLMKNRPELVAKAREVYTALKERISSVAWDDNGNVGKRYRRQDEIGTPYCVTIDFESLEKDTVTVRDRDTGAQERVSVSELAHTLLGKMKAS